MRNLFKKIAISSSICVMMLTLAACGDKEESTEETTTEATTEAATEASTTEEASATGEDATATDAIDIDENGKLTLAGMTIVIPDGYEYSADDSAENSATFVDYTNSGAIVIGVDNANTEYTQENVVDVFDEQIKVPYGDDITHSSVLYNGHEATEWVLDNADNGYVGRSLVICDGSYLIYIEYINYSGSIDAYTEAVSTIEY